MPGAETGAVGRSPAVSDVGPLAICGRPHARITLLPSSP